MRKIFACALALTLLLGCVPALAMSVTSTGNALPFELKAPPTVAMTKTDGDSPTTMQLTYSMDNAMCEFLKQKETAEDLGEFFAPYPYDDLWVNIQVDWAVDDVNDAVSGWHCNDYWYGIQGFGLGYDDQGRLRVSDWDVVDCGIGGAQTVNDIWVTRGVPNDSRFNGDPEQLTPGIKDQLREDQYTYDYEAETVVIDFTQHTMYLRVRFVVITRTETEDNYRDDFYYSDWSETVAYGKDAAGTDIDLSVIKAPVVTGLRMTDELFNDCPVVAFTLTVPDELSSTLTKLQAMGGYVSIETEARLRDGSDWYGLQGDWTVTSGEMTAALQNLYQNEVIENNSEVLFRARYFVQPADGNAFTTDWSNIITFGSDSEDTFLVAVFIKMNPNIDPQKNQKN